MESSSLIRLLKSLASCESVCCNAVAPLENDAKQNGAAVAGGASANDDDNCDDDADDDCDEDRQKVNFIGI